MRRLFLLLSLLLLMTTAAAGEKLVIPVGVTVIQADAFRNDVTITQVELPEGLTSIGERAFLGTGITSLQLPDGLELRQIGAEAFPRGTMLYGEQDGLEEWAAENGYRVRKIYALVIGMDYMDYAQDFSVLPACEYDATAFSEMLDTMNADPVSITVKRNLTRQGMMDAIDAAYAGAEPGDLCVFYYTGHGADDGALVSVDYESTGGMELKALREKLDHVKGTKLIVLDSCFSGRMIRELGGSIYYISRNGGAPIDLQAMNRLVIDAFSSGWTPRDGSTPEYLVITASTDNQTSGAWDTFSLFTEVFLQGCGYDELIMRPMTEMDADTDHSGFISQKQIYTYVRRQTRGYNQVVQAYPTDGCAYDLWGRKR